MKTMICLILDRSGSMADRVSDVIGGVNLFIEEQRKLPDPASIAFVRFDTIAIERFRQMMPIASVEPLTTIEFQPRGGTPLLDAVGQTIVALDEDWRREQPERAVVVIVTDGEENSSHEYTKAKIKEMIEAREASKKWSFIYLGTNVDAFQEAVQMGISPANTANYKNTGIGTRSAFAAASVAAYNTRVTGNVIATNLGGDLQEDGTIVKLVTEEGTTPPVGATVWTPPDAAATVWSPPKP